jgi:hypothetical protein
MIDIDMLYQELERIQNLAETLLRSFEYRDLEDLNQPDIALVKHIVESLSKLEHQVAASTQYFYFNRAIKGGEESQSE